MLIYNEKNGKNLNTSLTKGIVKYLIKNTNTINPLNNKMSLSVQGRPCFSLFLRKIKKHKIVFFLYTHQMQKKPKTWKLNKNLCYLAGKCNIGKNVHVCSTVLIFLLKLSVFKDLHLHNLVALSLTKYIARRQTS